jgi:carboxymethylenebutenolidase
MVSFDSNGGETPGYLVRPEVGQHPGLVVIQEWWGLVPHIKDVARRFARQGFIALAPDLYHGEAASEPDDARKLAMELDRERAIIEIQAAIKYLQGLDAVQPKMIGVVGWCMGGALTIYTAASSGDVGAAVAFYGGIQDVGIAASIKAPLLGLYGEHDHGIPVDMLRKFDAELEKYGVTHEIHIYEGAEHAFFNDARPHSYNPQAAEDAWNRTLGWFRQYIKT